MANENLWYVLQVRTGKETDIKAKIMEAISKEACRVLAPERVLIERRQGRYLQITRIMFPGYLFLNVALNDSIYYQIKQVPNIIRFLGTTRPTPVSNEQMQPILRMCSLGELIDISKISVGKTVEVIEGALQGYVGNIVSIDKRKKRARVRFQILDETKEIDLGIEVVGSN
ncbi:antiterminator LoaP [Dehalobacter sp. TeCB1]|uniref:antiterminator LoaP n=1 Tax=Dehalobacter sp. TeCB1 TaxID=1843715 RepID=UPI00083A8530|nr:antiterminator LoaP [Dehalobacter sp. TeCB1]OCZ53806.1 hypothetical protein A7D23_07540 [Dehalobacter sp. TeCB1]